jgi:hypothetical protein
MEQIAAHDKDVSGQRWILINSSRAKPGLTQKSENSLIAIPSSPSFLLCPFASLREIPW